MHNFAKCVVFAMALFASHSALGDEPPCDLSEIRREISTGTLGNYRVKSIAAQFTNEVLYIPGESGVLFRKEVVLPHLVIELDASSHPARIKAAVDGIASQIEHVDKSTSIKTVGTEGTAAKLIGDLTVEKWLKMDGFKCEWQDEWWGGYPRCSRTEWKTRLFRHSFEWQSKTRLRVRTGFAANNRPAPSAVVASRDAFDQIKEADLVTNGSADTHISNDIERLVADIIFWFGSALTGDFNNFNIEREIPELKANDTLPLDARSTLYPKEKGFVYRDSSKMVGIEGYRGLWQIFVDTLNFDEGRSGYGMSSSGLTLQLVYTQDNIRFAQRLSENRRPDSLDPVIDPFFKRFFCAAPDSRKKISDYMDELVERFEGKGTSKFFSGDEKSFREQVRRLYGTSRAVSFLTKENWIKKTAAGYEGSLPGTNEIWNNKRIVLPWDTLTSHAAFFDSNIAFYQCVRKSLAKKRRSQNRILPFDYFDECESSSGVSVEQQKILEAIDARRKIATETNPIAPGDYGAPVSGATYRGWYYCYRNPRMCVGKNQMMWWQQPSMFNERDGNHKGIDLIGDDFLGETAIYAAVAGQVIYSDRDKGGWGNALLIPFEVDSITYYAVYGHLPVTAKSFDGKHVRKGDSLGATGCTGNSGDGSGSCNTYCSWSGSRRTDEHLHFELLRKGADGKNEAIDPVNFLGFSVSKDNRQFRAKCDEQVVSLISRR